MHRFFLIYWFKRQDYRISLAGSLSDKILLMVGQLLITTYGAYVLIRKYPKIFFKKDKYKEYMSKERGLDKRIMPFLKKFAYVFFLYQLYLIFLTFLAGFIVAWEKGFCYLNPDGIIRGLEIDTFEQIDGGLEEQLDKQEDIEMTNNPLAKPTNTQRLGKDSSVELSQISAGKHFRRHSSTSLLKRVEGLKKNHEFFKPTDEDRILSVFDDSNYQALKTNGTNDRQSMAIYEPLKPSL